MGTYSLEGKQGSGLTRPKPLQMIRALGFQNPAALFFRKTNPSA